MPNLTRLVSKSRWPLALNCRQRAIALFWLALAGVFLCGPARAQDAVRAANVEIAIDAIGKGQNDAYKALEKLQKTIAGDNKSASIGKKGNGDTFEVVVDNTKTKSISESTPVGKKTGNSNADSNSTRPAPAKVKEARWQYRVVNHHIKEAKAALKKAREAKDPAMRHYYLRVAEENKSWAEGTIRKLNSNLGVNSSAAQPPAKLIESNFNFEKKKAWQQLLEISGGDPDRQGRKNLGRFDDPNAPLPKPPHPGKLKPKVQDLFKNIKSKFRREIIKFPHGQQIDIGPIRRAIAKLSRKDAKKKLFVKCGKGKCPSRTLLKYFSTEQLRIKLQKVGGVALNVTIDMLGSAGISDFRSGGEIKLVDRPVLISLNRLVAAVKSYATGNTWVSLPAKLRHPGNIDRVFGFVLDPVSEDIYLIGTTTKKPHRRIDIDSLILAVRQTWREGLDMAVSLDSKPGFMVGPSTPRFENVPGDSITAKIMIEADYVMKHMVSAWGPYADQRYMPLSKIEARFTAEKGSSGRYWLNPKKMARDAMYVSVTGRTVLFESQVQALTEEAFLTNGRYQYSGSTGGTRKARADEFTKRYETYEKQDDIAPAGIFRRLHGIIDLVTLAKLWRINALDYPVLDAIADLPYRRLTGDEAIKKSYPETYSWYPAEGSSNYLIYGGAVLDIGVSTASIYRNEDPRIVRLEKLVDNIRRKIEGGKKEIRKKDFKAAFKREIKNISKATGRKISLKNARVLGIDKLVIAKLSGRHTIVHKTAMVLGLPRQTGGGAQSVKLLLLSAERASRSADNNKALEIFTKVTKLYPMNAQAWAERARIEAGLGEQDAALRSIRTAVHLAPWVVDYEYLALHLLWQRHPDLLMKHLDTETRITLADKFIALSASALRKGRSNKASAYATSAVKINPNDPKTYYQRALAISGVTSADLDRALDLKPDYLDAYMERAKRYHWMKKFGAAIRDYDQVIELQPVNKKALLRRGHSRLGLTPYGEKQILVTLGYARPHYYQKPNQAISDYKKALKIDPKLTQAWRGIGHSYLVLDDLAKAAGAYEKAIAIDPTGATDIAFRGEIRRLQGNLKPALADFNEAERLGYRNRPVYAGRGKVYLAQSRFEKALEDFTRYIEFSHLRNKFDGYILRARAYRATGQSEKAFDDFSNAIKWHRASKDARIGRADVAVDLGWYRQAFRDLKVAYNNHSLTAEIMIVRARAYFKQGKTDQAGQTLISSRKYKIQDKGYLLVRAQLFEKLNYDDEAAEDYRRILRFNPKDTAALRALERLK